MLRTLGPDEIESIVQERGQIEVGCEYCGQQYRFDPIDAATLFTGVEKQPPSSEAVQ
jgi:molecular chaperone Hsp33